MEVYAKNVVEFVTVGVEYCAFMERINEKTYNTFVPVLQKLLPFLYLKASMVNKPLSLCEDSLETFVSEVDYETIRMGAAHVLGQYDEEFTGEEVVSVSECLTDVYQDVKDFLMNYKGGQEEVMNDALFNVVENFELYWGKRLLQALTIIHKLAYIEPDVDEE
ncbi:MAG: DUF5063 domain-containing protein [Paludibacteraceae bacterium]|jgi:hypothetical protein|nr:DUF5063 domain-containing protein [Paludibacteraceae bacterium]MED9996031.1 DUF5063 domain-containing protein [Paludibacteraceae bacterium]